MALSVNKAIEQTQAELELLKGRMEEIRRQFVRAAGEFIAGWYAGFARDCAQQQAEQSLALGRERLGALKAKLAALTGTAGAIAEEVFADRCLWWHLSGDDTLLYLCSDGNPPGNLDNSLRLALGRLGPLLKDYGYAVTELQAAKSADRRQPAAGDEPAPADHRPCFQDFLAWPQSLRELIGQYNGLLEQAKRNLQELHRLQREQKRAAAAELWDSV